MGNLQEKIKSWAMFWVPWMLGFLLLVSIITILVVESRHSKVQDITTANQSILKDLHRMERLELANQVELERYRHQTLEVLKEIQNRLDVIEENARKGGR